MARPIHILFITGEYPPAVGGVGDYTRQLGRALIDRGQRVSVLTSAPANEQDDRSEPAVIPLGTTWSWPMWRQALRVIRLLTPDVVHIQYQTGAYAMHPAINLLPWRIRRLPQRPRIAVTAHDLRLPYLLPKAAPLRAWVTARLFDDADALILSNAEDQRRARGQSPPDRELFSPRSAVGVPTTVIPIGTNITPQPHHGYDRERWRGRLGLAPDTVLLAYFGLLNRSKGVLDLLAALAELPPRFRLLIIGGAAPLPEDQRYAAEVQATIVERGLSERVQITGPCTEAEVSGHLLAADMTVLPFLDGASYRRGSLLAALAHGTPTITTAPPTPLDPPLEDGAHALVLPKADAVLLRAAIERLAADRALQARMATGARVVAAAFGWPGIAERHEALYHTLLGAIHEKAEL
ncbi:MAG TPA: glycosyltransferase family 4 protein [Herpetosiphonaceae bacterium]